MHIATRLTFLDAELAMKGLLKTLSPSLRGVPIAIGARKDRNALYQWVLNGGAPIAAVECLDTFAFIGYFSFQTSLNQHLVA